MQKNCAVAYSAQQISGQTAFALGTSASGTVSTPTF
jgi:hypothetical protein